MSLAKFPFWIWHGPCLDWVPHIVFATTPLELQLARRNGATLKQLALRHWLQMLCRRPLGQLLPQRWQLLVETLEALAEWLHVDTGGTLHHLLEVGNIDVDALGSERTCQPTTRQNPIVFELRVVVLVCVCV